jgi:tetratricopeptide (TPR) repeat protein
MLAQARTLEADQEFLNAVELLSGALRRVPHSTPLRELRTALESRRVHQLKVNERNSLIVRAEYLLDRKRLYAQQINLQAPSFEQRREHEKQENQRIALSKQLLEHARYAMQVQELDAADTCLTLAQRLNEAAEAAGLKAELRAVQKSQQESDRKAVSIRKARIKRKTDLNEKDETEKLLATTQKALNENNLHDAREAFTKIPPSTSQDSEVVAVQNTLDQAVSTRVEHLIVTGDAQYRADQISEALQTWSEALALDPDNVELRERTDRANKVLANLEELKRQQRK